MTIYLRLKHLWAGTVNSPTANPFVLALREQGQYDAVQINTDHFLSGGKVHAIPFKVADYLRRISHGADRFEALPEDVHKALNQAVAEGTARDKRAAKRGRDQFTPVDPNFPIFSVGVNL